MAPRAKSIAFALVVGTSAKRVADSDTEHMGTVHQHTPFNKHNSANCFIHQGGEPVDPEGDPPLHEPVGADECMLACDLTPMCVGVTHENRDKGLCYLRKAIDIDRCQSNPDYNSYTHPHNWVDPGDNAHDTTCGDLNQQPNLLCARHVEWAFIHGKHATWAPLAYLELPAIAGVNHLEATTEDFQRLSYCVNFRNSKGEIVDREDPCEMPPCSCSNPPCGVCAIDRTHSHADRATAEDVEHADRDCPVPPDNGGCADVGEHNRFCPHTHGCFSTSEAHLCPDELCPAPSDAQHPITPPGLATEHYGYENAGEVFGHWGWCRANAPMPEWNLHGGELCNKGPAVTIKVLTYNLFWWNLFGIRGGMWQSAGKLIQRTGPYDIMGFQECDDINRIVGDTGMGHEYGRFAGSHAVSNAWRQTEWEVLAEGVEDVAEDHRAQWYGRRGLVWSRIRHYRSGAIVFFANHHGPLPVGYPGGGFCGPEATAYNILKVIGRHAHKGDAVILTGDFNAIRNSRTQQTLSRYLTHHYQGSSFDGVDNFYSNDCAVKVDAQNHGNGGSDHDALSITFTLNR